MTGKKASPLMLLKKLKESGKSPLILMALGFAGILLIFCSQMFSGEPSEPEAEETDSSEYIVYSRELQKQLEDFVSSIEGAGNAKVMLSFYDDGESFYLKEETTGSDSSKEEYVITDGKNGKSAVITSRRFPQVKGVAILCEGGDNVLLKAKVVEAVAVALGISYNNVYVSKIAS